MARQILPSKEIARIWERGEYDEDEQAWILPHIKPRASYAGDICKLPLIAGPPVGAGGGGGGGVGVGDDASSQASRIKFGGGTDFGGERGGGGLTPSFGEALVTTPLLPD